MFVSVRHAMKKCKENVRATRSVCTELTNSDVLSRQKKKCHFMWCVPRMLLACFSVSHSVNSVLRQQSQAPDLSVTSPPRNFDGHLYTLCERRLSTHLPPAPCSSLHHYVQPLLFWSVHFMRSSCSGSVPCEFKFC